MIIINLKRPLSDKEVCSLDDDYPPKSFAYAWPYRYIMFNSDEDGLIFTIKYGDIVLSHSDVSSGEVLQKWFTTNRN